MRPLNVFDRSVPRLLTMASVSLVLSACGGGGDGGTPSGGLDVPGLVIPNQVNLIDAKESDASSDGLAGDGMSGDTTSDYSSDLARTYVYDPSMDALQTVNQILCYVSQTAASERVNAGPYIALVDAARCEKENGDDGGSQSTGGEADSNAPDYQQWVVDVTRDNASAPQRVKFWVPGDGDGSDPLDDQTILAELTITAAPTAALPNGEFVLNFKGALDGASLGMTGTEIAVMRGTLKTVSNAGAGSQLSFINESGALLPGLAALGVDFSSLERANVISGADGADTGRALTSIERGSNGSSQGTLFAIDFDATGMQRGQDANDNAQIESGELACLSREDFDTYGWRYNLYHAGSGDRVELNSGFSFDKVNGVNAMGYVGYWGVWSEAGEGLSDGDQISRRPEGDEAEEIYTVALSEGKLRKRSLGTVEFSDLLGAELNWWGDASDPSCASGCSDSYQHVANIDASGVVTVTHRWESSGDDNELVELNAPIDITPTNAGDTLNLWSDALGGSVNYQQGSSTLAAYSQENLSADAAELSAGLNLVCYSQCPVGGLFEPAPSDDLYHGDGRFTYTLSSAAGKYSLVDDSNGLAVALRSTENLGEGSEHTSLYAGPMVTVTDDPGLANWWEIYNAGLSYNWQSGPQDWNKTTAVLDADNELVAFDQPLQFFYTYSAGDDINTDPALADHPAGNAYRLSYGGVGDLWGFPYSPEANCSDDNCPYYPSITLADGVLLGANDEYKVRLMEGEQRMREDAGACASLDAVAVLADTALALPTEVDGDVSFSISDKPDLSGQAPVVIEGVVQ